MILHFVKMQGAGNDFIIADNSAGLWPTDPSFFQKICDRHKGIGADGLILLQYTSETEPIKMRYFNSDGSYAAACGNGLRCAASFVYQNYPGHLLTPRLLCGNQIMSAEIKNEAGTHVRITMPVTEPFKSYLLESGEIVYKGSVGVPHVIAIRKDVDAVDVVSEGRRLRYHPLFQPEGANVDFIEADDAKNVVKIRTYERGVEDETLACGTGCSSSAVILHQFLHFSEKILFLCRGKDEITVEILKECCNLSGVDLTGPAMTVFRGEIDDENFT